MHNNKCTGAGMSVKAKQKTKKKHVTNKIEPHHEKTNILHMRKQSSR